jgi:hypothetical protein
MTGAWVCLVISAPTSLAAVSVKDPGAKGTTNLIVLLGHAVFCARLAFTDNNNIPPRQKLLTHELVNILGKILGGILNSSLGNF